jgi:hypothetical protein
MSSDTRTNLILDGRYVRIHLDSEATQVRTEFYDGGRLLVNSVQLECRAVTAINKAIAPINMPAARNRPHSRPKMFAVSASLPIMVTLSRNR